MRKSKIALLVLGAALASGCSAIGSKCGAGKCGSKKTVEQATAKCGSEKVEQPATAKCASGKCGSGK
jgi:uncharacterized low-complexity protein